MKIVHESPYLEVLYKPAEKILYINAKEKIGNLLTEEYQKMILEMLNDIDQIKQINAILDDGRQSTLAMSVETQPWIVQEYAKFFIPRGLSKFALVLPEKFISELSYEQAIDEAQAMLAGFNIQIQAFKKVELAEKWLIE